MVTSTLTTQNITTLGEQIIHTPLHELKLPHTQRVVAQGYHMGYNKCKTWVNEMG